jgi:LysM repeat protein
MVAKNPGRYLAPVAIVAVAVAIGLLVNARLASHHTVATPPAQQQQHQQQATTASHHVKPRKAFYVIKPGDTLSGISVKTKVPIATLEALNPSLQANALQTGTRLRLR